MGAHLDLDDVVAGYPQASAELASLRAINAALLDALTHERRIRLIGQLPECARIHWESPRVR
jgi:uncharacterized tellurite resistance protein B-like protein